MVDQLPGASLREQRQDHQADIGVIIYPPFADPLGVLPFAMRARGMAL